MYFLFAWRYFRAKKSTNAINIIAWISIGAITIGTAALILVLSVFNGFEDLVKSLYSSFYTDLKVSADTGKVITVTEEQLNRLRGVEGVRNFSLVKEEKAMLQNGEYQSIVWLKGVDEQYRYVTGVAQNLIKGNFELGNPDNPSMVLGTGIENAVGVESDRNIFPLIVYLPRRGTLSLGNPMQNISADTAFTSGAFMIQQEFDNKYAITNLGFVQRMLGMNADEYGGIEISITEPGTEEAVRERVQQIFGSGYRVLTRYEQNQGLYAVMRTEKWVIYAVLSLILLVAAFTMIAALTMLVLEKEKDISVLYSLGAGRNFIQKLFLSEGVLLAVVGGVSGMLLAALIAWLQLEFKLIPLQGGSFLINYFPVKLQAGDFLLVGITVFVIALIAAWLPARKAAMREFSLRSE